MKKSFFKAIVIALASTNCGIATNTSSVKSDGPKGALFEVIPLDINQKCRANILRGTQRFKGTAYIMPTFVVQGTSGSPALEVFKRPSDGKYVVQLILRPLSGEEPIDTAIGEQLQPICDFMTVKSYLASLQGEDTITTLSANLPIRRMEVKILGLKNVETSLIGSTETSLLEYQNKPQLAEFVLTADEFAELRTRLNGQIGVGIDVDTVFNAQAVTAYLDAKVQSQKIAKKLENYLLARFSAMPELITETELQQAIGNIMDSNSTEILLEGSDAYLEEIAKALTDKVISNATTTHSLSSITDNTRGTSAGVEPPVLVSDNPAPLPRNPGMPVFVQPGTIVQPQPYQPGPINPNNPFVPGPVIPSPGVPVQPTPTEPPEPFTPIKVNVKSALTYLNSQSTISVRVTRLGETEVQRQTSRLILKSDGSNLGQTSLKIVAGVNSNRLPSSVEANSTFEIFQKSQTLELLQYGQSVHYYSKNEIKDNNKDLGNHFPYLQALSSRYLKEFSSVFGARGYVYQGYFFNPFNWKYYTWGEQLTTLKSKALLSKKTLSKLAYSESPLKLNFSKLGPQFYTIPEILSLNDSWEAQYDQFTSSLKLQAKRDLGYVTFANTGAYSAVKYAPVKHFQELWSTFPSKILETTYSSHDEIVTAPKQVNTVYVDISQGDTTAEHIRLVVSGDSVFVPANSY